MTDEQTPLQQRLGNISLTFTKWGLYAALIIFATALIRYILTVVVGSNSGSVVKDTLYAIVSFCTLAITVVIVIAPEGLPLTVGISLAYSVKRMKKDKILIKDLTSPEQMGGVEDILCGKTATLTKNQMEVREFYIQKQRIRNLKRNTFLNSSLDSELVQVVQDCILFNCTARIEMDENAMYKPVGNGTECALLTFLQQNEIPIHDEIKRKHHNEVGHIPFSSERKIESVAVKITERKVRFVVKGAPEIIFDKCTRSYDTDGSERQIGEDENEYMRDGVLGNLAKQGYRCFAYAYKDIDLDDFLRQKEQSNNFKDEADRAAIEQDLTFAALFALHDPIRGSVPKSFEYARRGLINVKVVSGDHIETAKAVALKTGLIQQHEAEERGVCMEGSEFRRIVGRLESSRDAEGNVKYKLSNQEEFHRIAASLKVLARANPEDKLALVVGLQSMGRQVAVTGDSNNDAKALFQADVGLAMGSGCEAAKDNSKMILINDNFSSVLFANMWGRNIYSNIRKFLVFQITVGIASIAFLVVGLATFGVKPLNIVQLLWINLVMDTLAALALATEPPHCSILINGKPTRKDDAILTPVMWR